MNLGSAGDFMANTLANLWNVTKLTGNQTSCRNCRWPWQVAWFRRRQAFPVSAWALTRNSHPWPVSIIECHWVIHGDRVFNLKLIAFAGWKDHEMFHDVARFGLLVIKVLYWICCDLSRYDVQHASGSTTPKAFHVAAPMLLLVFLLCCLSKVQKQDHN